MSTTDLLSVKHCTVTAQWLQTYQQRTENSPHVHRFMKGQQINYTNVGPGENINRNGHHTNLWAFNPDTNSFFWLGDTDHPIGVVMPTTDLSVRHCMVTVQLLQTYTQPTAHSQLVHTFMRGQQINYSNTELGQPINDNNHWAFNPDTKSYFWLGGTDHPNG